MEDLQTLKERQRSILSALIQEHIKTARPVGSQHVWRNFELSIAPATIRNEMLSLDKMGYLDQPHTSAGRIPTDKGYRFFVDHLLAHKSLAVGEQEALEEAFALESPDEFIRDLAKTITRISQTFTAVGTLSNHTMYESGFSELLEEPEFYDREQVKLFGRFVDSLDEHAKHIINAASIDFENVARILIGEENPIKEAREYAMVLSLWRRESGEEGFIAMIGPKRTNYRKHKALLEKINELCTYEF